MLFMSFYRCCDRLETWCIVLVKEHFFLLYLWQYFDYFFLQMHQWCYILFTIDGSSFPRGLMNKIPCASQNTEAIILPADVCIFGCFGWLSPDCRFDFGVKWWIHVSPIVTYLHKNIFLLHWNSCKLRFHEENGCIVYYILGITFTANRTFFSKPAVA